MNCPVCKEVELRISERQNVEIDYCPQCRGVWLDKGELDKLIERSLQQETPRVENSRVEAPPEYSAPAQQYQQPPKYQEARYEQPRYEKRRDHDDDDDDDYYRRHGKRRKKGGWLGEILDFD